MMKKETELPPFARFVLPGLATACCVLMVLACLYVHSAQMLGYLIFFAVDMALGAIVLLRKKNVISKCTEKDS